MDQSMLSTMWDPFTDSVDLVWRLASSQQLVLIGNMACRGGATRLTKTEECTVNFSNEWTVSRGAMIGYHALAMQATLPTCTHGRFDMDQVLSVEVAVFFWNANNFRYHQCRLRSLVSWAQCSQFWMRWICKAYEWPRCTRSSYRSFRLVLDLRNWIDQNRVSIWNPPMCCHAHYCVGLPVKYRNLFYHYCSSHKIVSISRSN